MSSSDKRALERDGHFANFADAADSKLILLITITEAGVADGFTIGLNRASLTDLRAAARAGTFACETHDGSLGAEGQESVRTSSFVMTSTMFARAKLPLTALETTRVRDELLGESVS